LAEKEGKERLVALQLEYSLVERNIEREHVPAAQDSDLVLPRGVRWPAAFLPENTSGREQRESVKAGWR